ncbi:hypothetical protein ACFLZB_02250 [Nanoarchaeota archaeon]
MKEEKQYKELNLNLEHGSGYVEIPTPESELIKCLKDAEIFDVNQIYAVISGEKDDGESSDDQHDCDSPEKIFTKRLENLREFGTPTPERDHVVGYWDYGLDHSGLLEGAEDKPIAVAVYDATKLEEQWGGDTVHKFKNPENRLDALSAIVSVNWKEADNYEGPELEK